MDDANAQFNPCKIQWARREGRLTKTNSSSQLPLAGQIAVITGAGRGIGQAVALKLAALGAHTVLCGRAREALEQTSRCPSVRHREC
jgi:NADP-dependent 3-hydroxy acid dehydrogenase YdfG